MGELNKILNSDAFKSTKGILKCVIGKDMDGKEVIFDLRKAPHVLITGDDANKNTKYILAIIESLASVSTDKCLALALINMESSLEKYNSYLYSKASLNDTLEAIYNEMENQITEELEEQLFMFGYIVGTELSNEVNLSK